MNIEKLAKNNPEGFTVSLPNLEPVTKGYAVAYKDTQDSFGTEGLKKAYNHAMSHDKIIGGWLNKKNNQYYYDSIKIFQNEEQAKDFGRDQEQIAIFDLNTMTEIEL
jgi:fructokinase